MVTPNPLLVRFASLLEDESLTGPVLDLACGRGGNGLFLAGLSLPVVLADRSPEALGAAQVSAEEQGLDVQFREVDLETEKVPLRQEYYRAILVFRYLHRPLMPSIRRAVREGGMLFYESFINGQPKRGSPGNPDQLLKPGELADWFQDWQIVHYYEGLLGNRRRPMAQIVCRKPGPQKYEASRQ